ncbi:murein biosynthesis integral membrane protein MurJ [uncultured Pseudokineococcus sp.]|uniref:murein biosynthesis integral membrane protein MurJ n=1 Tax=uncultured Pseudokineococcus sp. TaxID=1642928 RepID=UPI002635D5EB|nr:murein biosynthesis integral membrane protein MurJ [uncultured Pseudokineococcus sp.]
MSTPSTSPAGGAAPPPDAGPDAAVAPAAGGLRSLVRSSSVMAAGTAVSRVLGLVRSIVLVTAIGAVGTGADAFDVANRIPNIVYLLIAGGVLNAVLVPQIVRASRDADGGKVFVDRLVTLVVAGLAAVTGVCLLAAPLLVWAYASSWGGDELRLATAIALWVLPQVFFYGLYTVLGQVLNARGSFGPYMWAPVVNNVVAISGLLVFLALFGRAEEGVGLETLSSGMVALLAGTATLGVVAQALVLLVPLRRLGFTWTPRFGVRGVGLRSAGTVALWTFGGILVSQAAFLVTTQVAVYATEGAGEPLPEDVVVPGPAVLGLAYLLYVLPHSLVAVSVVTALFTRLAGRISDGDETGARADMSLGLRLLGVVSVLSATGLVVLGPPVGVLLFGAGSGGVIGATAAAMALGLPFYSALYLVQRGFYAREDGRRPFVGVAVAAATSTLLNVVVALTVPAERVVVGLGVSQALGNVAGLVTALVLLHRTAGSFDGSRVLRLHVRVLLAAVVAGLAGWGASSGVQALLSGITSRPTALAVVLVAGAVVVVVYVLMLRVTRVRELDDVVAQVRRGR